MAWDKLAAMGALGFMPASWFVWVTVSVFRHRMELALIRKEIEIMGDVRDLLVQIKSRMQHPKRTSRDAN